LQAGTLARCKSSALEEVAMPTIVAVRGEAGTRYRVQVRLRGAAPQSATFERKTDARRWG
jgi:hypothetical protein